jgi:NitT/TauT family transport system substrate-binding protein
MRKKALHLFLASLLLIVLPLSACGSGQKTLKMAEVTHSVFYAPLYAAIELGYFEEEGIELELTNVGGADKAMTALIANQADIAFCGPEAAIYVYNEGRTDAVSVFGQVTVRDGAFLLGREPDDDFQWSDLKGKSVIGGRRGGMPCMALEHTLRVNGLVPGETVDVMTHVQFDLMAGAFAGGEGDYVTLFEPAATQAQEEGYGTILAAVGEGAGKISYTCYMATKEALAEDPDTYKAFLRAFYKGQQYVQSHTSAEIAAAIAPAFADTDVHTLTQVAERYRAVGVWNTVPAVDLESIENLMMVMEEAGELAARPPLEDLVDNSLAEEVIAE